MEQRGVDYDLIIVGAGPAGCGAALALSDSKMKVLLLDKENFPRDKTCGDAIPERALLELDIASSGLRDDFLKLHNPHSFNRSSIILPHGKKLTMNWSLPGYMLPRRQFDSFLMDRVIKTGKITVKQGCQVEDLVQGPDSKVVVRCKDGSEFTSRLVIGADGPKSVVSKKLSGYKVPVNRYGSAVRSYFSKANIEDDSESMVFVDKKYPAGYFWIFPLGGGRVNVGFGMLHRKRKKINSLEAFNYFINENPSVNKIMKDSVADSNIAGGGLPFALEKRILSGSAYLLAGDAASLVDPFSGDGIQSAAKSGVLAAKYAMKAVSENKIDASCLADYDSELYGSIWPDLKKRALMMRIGAIFPGLVYLGIRIGSIPIIYRWLKSWV